MKTISALLSLTVVLTSFAAAPAIALEGVKLAPGGDYPRHPRGGGILAGRRQPSARPRPFHPHAARRAVEPAAALSVNSCRRQLPVLANNAAVIATCRCLGGMTA